KLVNENMFGALRLVSVEKGYDPRDFALIAFGGAGPLHANALGRLMNAWPVIIPPGPGVLCAYGDATTRMRNEAARTYIKRFSDTSPGGLEKIFEKLAAKASKTLDKEGVPKKDQTLTYQADLRYHGQGLTLTVDVDLDAVRKKGLGAIGDQFDEMHRQLFTFALEEEKELVNLRAVVNGKPTTVKPAVIEKGGKSAKAAVVAEHDIYVDGKDRKAKLYHRSRLEAGNEIPGPAIVLEMDSTTLILPDHTGKVDEFGNILIRPDA
ncbi:MAG: hydantoinase/oxoprolinase family protein, partial [Gemmatimonadota bacterium]